MDITLKRNEYQENGIYGKFLDENGQFVCVTLEHAFDDGRGGWAAAIPPGTYSCHRRISPRFGYELFYLADVPGHTWIEIHKGNWNSDSTGCILLGDKLGQGMILNSKLAFERFMQLQDGLDSFQLLVLP